METSDPRQAPSGGDATPATLPPQRAVSVVAPPGLVSVLVPCCGQLEYTKLCVPGVLKHSRPPFELVFLDIGSLDGTAEYLAGVAVGASSVRVEVVRAATDPGIGAAVERGLAMARGEYVVLLNNDTIVPEGWLNHLTGLANASPAIGLVGPMSNYAAPPQLVESVPYRVGPHKGVSGLQAGATGEFLVDVAAVEAFARQWRDKEGRQWKEVERLGGFCLLVKRQVLQKLEQSGPVRGWADLGLFDTDVLSARARAAGFTLACCRDLFVHHFGTRVFAQAAPGQRDA